MYALVLLLYTTLAAAGRANPARRVVACMYTREAAAEHIPALPTACVKCTY